MKLLGGLPQLRCARPFLTEGGIETTLLFQRGLALPQFSLLPHLLDPADSPLIAWFYEQYAQLAKDRGVGLVLETPTWRVGVPWAAKLGHAEDDMERVVREACVSGMDVVKSVVEKTGLKRGEDVVVSGCVGPLGDAYSDRARKLGVDEAKNGFRLTLETLAKEGVDSFTAMTMSNVEEVVAVLEIGRELGLPVVVMWTVETDGNLLGGRTLEAVIEEVEKRVTDPTGVSYHGICCAHPKHFEQTLREMAEETRKKIAVVRANASEKSHQELDESEDLDRGDAKKLGACYKTLMELLPNLKVVGGCCGTDIEHIRVISENVHGPHVGD